MLPQTSGVRVRAVAAIRVLVVSECDPGRHHVVHSGFIGIEDTIRAVIHAARPALRPTADALRVHVLGGMVVRPVRMSSDPDLELRTRPRLHCADPTVRDGARRLDARTAALEAAGITDVKRKEQTV